MLRALRSATFCSLLAGAPACALPSAIDASAPALLPDAPEPQADTPPTAPMMLTGTLVDPDDAAVPQASVTLKGATGAPAFAAVADGRGRFTLSAPPGAYTLLIAAPGFEPSTGAVTLLAGARALDLGELQLKVKAVDAEVEVTQTRAEIAEVQIKQEEKQRLFGLLPNFYVTYASDPAPLSAKQKFKLAGRTAVDPSTFVVAGIVAGVEQQVGTLSGYGYGAPGYFTRFGAAYGDAFTGILISAAVVPALFHQDPRYFYKGTGSVKSRVGYALASPFRIKGDNGRWQVNYSDISGTIAAAAVANAYAPAKDRSGAGVLVLNSAISTLENAVAALAQEFLLKYVTTHTKGVGGAEQTGH